MTSKFNMFHILSENDAENVSNVSNVSMKKEKKEKKEKKVKKETLSLTATKPIIFGSWAECDDEPLDFSQPLILTTF